MDRDSLQFLFQNNFTTIKEFLIMIIDALREEISQLKGDNDELRSLEFTQAELTEMRKTCAILNGEKQVNAVSYPEKRELLERVRNLEDYSRRNNLIVEGLQEESDENNEILQTSMEKLLKEKLDFTPKIDVVHRMGKQLDNSPRHVIFRLRTFRERQESLKLLPKLKGTNIYINEDISKATLEIRKTKLKESKDKAAKGFIAYFSGTELIDKPRKNSSQQTKEAVNNASK